MMITDNLKSTYVVELNEDKFQFTLFQFPEDVPLLYKWLNAKHTILHWKLNKSLDELTNHFLMMMADKHQKLFVVSLNGVPFAYCEIYSAAFDRISDHYKALDTDIGWHLLIGEREYLGRGLAKSLMYAVSEFIFNTTECSRIVGEPDVRVKWGIIADNFGYIKQKVIEFPEKKANLYFCYRNNYHNSFSYKLLKETNN